MDTRHSSGKPSWRELVLVQPAKAVTVYAVIAVVAVAVVLGAIGYVDLLTKTRAVCEPLRYGQHAGEKYASTPLGRDFTRTFEHSADELGCPK